MDRSLMTQRVLALLILTLAPALWVMAPSVGALHEYWTTTSSGSHGYLLLAFIGFLLAESLYRGELYVRSDRLSTAMLGVVLAASVLWGFGDAIGKALVREAAFVVTVAGLSVVTLRSRSLSALSLPLGLALFLAPIWWPLTPLLQQLTASFVAAVVWLLDVQAFVDGNQIQTAYGNMVVAEGCAGLHQFIVGNSLVWLYAHWFVNGWPRRLLAMVLGLGTVLLANWIRVTGLVFTGVISEMQHPLITDGHYVYGWLVFAIVCLAFAGLMRLLGLDSKRGQVAQQRDTMPVPPLGRAVVVQGLGLVVLIAGVYLGGSLV